MKEKEFKIAFHTKSSSLPPERQLQFAVTICKSLYFDYDRFSKLNNWGNSVILLDAISFCSGANLGDVHVGSVRKVLADVESITPDMDDFGDEPASCALNACTAVEDTLQFIIDNDHTHILNIATYFTDTVYFKLMGMEDFTLEQLNEHTQMKEARNFLIEQTL